MKKSGYALVLSGGGALGVYHIGAWRALREMKISINAVVGNSVGALIAGFVAQDSFEAVEKVLGSMDLDKIIKLPGGMIEKGKLVVTDKTMKHLNKIQDEIIKHKGLNTDPLRKLLKDNLDEEKIRKSGIELGVMTYQLSNLKPVEIFIDRMEEGLLVDYLMASASLPGFKATRIKKKRYIDGGVYNNIPFSMIKNRGYKRIIVIDISGLGVNRRPDITGTQTVYIKNSINMGSILDFDPKFLADYKLLGYLDTLKVFGEIDGIDFFIQPDPGLYKRLDKLLDTRGVTQQIRNLFGKSGKKGREMQVRELIRGLLPKDIRHHQNLVLCLAECAARSLNVKQVKLYSFSELIDILIKEYDEIDEHIRIMERTLNTKKIVLLAKKLAALARNTEIEDLTETPLYEYQRMLEVLLKSGKIKLPFVTIYHLFHHIAGARIFHLLLQEYTRKAG